MVFKKWLKYPWIKAYLIVFVSVTINSSIICSFVHVDGSYNIKEDREQTVVTGPVFKPNTTPHRRFSRIIPPSLPMSEQQYRSSRLPYQTVNKSIPVFNLTNHFSLTAVKSEIYSLNCFLLSLQFRSLNLKMIFKSLNRNLKLNMQLVVRFLKFSK